MLSIIGGIEADMAQENEKKKLEKKEKKSRKKFPDLWGEYEERKTYLDALSQESAKIDAMPQEQRSIDDLSLQGTVSILKQKYLEAHTILCRLNDDANNKLKNKTIIDYLNKEVFKAIKDAHESMQKKLDARKVENNSKQNPGGSQVTQSSKLGSALQEMKNTENTFQKALQFIQQEIDKKEYDKEYPRENAEQLKACSGKLSEACSAVLESSKKLMSVLEANGKIDEALKVHAEKTSSLALICEHYKQQIAVLSSQPKKAPRRNNAIKKSKDVPETQREQLGLGAAFLESVQRVPRYPLLLKEIIKNTPSTDTSFLESWRRMLSLTESAATFFNQFKLEAEAYLVHLCQQAINSIPAQKKDTDLEESFQSAVQDSTNKAFNEAFMSKILGYIKKEKPEDYQRINEKYLEFITNSTVRKDIGKILKCQQRYIQLNALLIKFSSKFTDSSLLVYKKQMEQIQQQLNVDNSEAAESILASIEGSVKAVIKQQLSDWRVKLEQSFIASSKDQPLSMETRNLLQKDLEAAATALAASDFSNAQRLLLKVEQVLKRKDEAYERCEKLCEKLKKAKEEHSGINMSEYNDHVREAVAAIAFFDQPAQVEACLRQLEEDVKKVNNMVKGDQKKHSSSSDNSSTSSLGSSTSSSSSSASSSLWGRFSRRSPSVSPGPDDGGAPKKKKLKPSQ